MSVEEIVGKMFVAHAEAGIEIKPSCIVQLAEEHPEHTSELKLMADFYARYKAAADELAADFYGRYKAASEEAKRTNSALTTIIKRLADANLEDNINQTATEAKHDESAHFQSAEAAGTDETDEKSNGKF